MEKLPDWLKDAIKRIQDENVRVFIDTPEKSAEYGVELGTIVIVRTPSIKLKTTQQLLDEFKAREYLRNQCFSE